MTADLRSAHIGWPLVGRREELEQAFQCLADPQSSGLLICGPEGVGKTRFTDEFLAYATASGRRIGQAIATTATAAVPLGALAHLLPPEISGWTIDAVAVFDRVAAEFDQDELRYVLAIDDLHLLDATSLALIAQLIAGGVIFLIATVRTDRPAPEATTELWRSGKVLRIDLGELSREAVDTLLHLALGGPVAGGTLSELWEASRGNLLFLRELVLGVHDAGSLVREHGVWRLAGPLISTGRLTDVVESRLRAAPDQARSVLELLALCEPVAVGDLLAVAEAQAIEELERSGLVSVHTDLRRQTVMLAHPLYAEVLRSRLPELTRRRILLEAAGRLDNTGHRRREDALRIATWQLDASGRADPGLLLPAAKLARYSHDFVQVARLARAALSQAASVEAGLLLGEALYELGEFDEAEELLAVAEARATEEGQLVQVVATRVRNMLWGLHRVFDAMEVNRAARRRVSGRDATNELMADEATLLMFSGNPGEALELIRGLGDDTDLRTRVVRAIPESVALRMTGRPESALKVAVQGFEDHLQLGDQLAIASPGSHMVNQVGALQDSGRLGEAVELASMGYALAAQYRSPIGRIWFNASKGYALQVSGLVRSAHTCYSEAVALCREYRYLAHLRFIITGLAVTAALLGDAAEAEAAMAESALLPALGGFETADLEFGQAWAIVAGTGDLPRARAVLLDAAALARRSGHRMSEIGLLHDVARLGDPTTVRDRVAELAGECEGALVAAYASHVSAAAAGDPDRLSDAVDGFELMGALLMAAETAAEASQAYARSGQPRKAAALRLRAAGLAGRCEGARTPALVSGESVTPLTRREREIAQLAAAGLASREIAARLHLSVRTVDNHLQSVYTKLGIPGRAELAASLDLAPGELPER